jgi:cell volume regulation protein A
MINVSLLFILFAGVVFLGYILNAMFYKFKISSILPMLLIGLLIGPLLHLVDTSQTSVVVEITPIITAIAVAFILFDVGMNIRISSLRNILLKASIFTILTSTVTGVIASIILHYAFGWGLLVSLMVGFAMSGTTSIVLPPLFKFLKVSEDMKTSLAYQSVFNDVFSLVIPLIFFNILETGKYSINYVAGELGGFVVGSLLLGIALAAFWIFILKKFKKYSSGYSWMLTLTIVVAVYGISEYLGFNGALSTFIFGILLANIPDIKFLSKASLRPIFDDIEHIKTYQKEITFFVSTFFFVYIGMLFQIQGFKYWIVGIAGLICIVMLLVRYLTTDILNGIISTGKHKKSDKTLMLFYVAQGLAPTVVATLPATIGLAVPNLIDVTFLVILITNGILSVGLYLYASERGKESRNVERTFGRAAKATPKAGK